LKAKNEFTVKLFFLYLCDTELPQVSCIVQLSIEVCALKQPKDPFKLS